MLLIGKLLQVGSSSSRFGHSAVPAGHVTIVLLGKNIYKSPCVCGCANLQSACTAQLYAVLDILFSSNHNIHKSSFSLCYCASDHLIDRFLLNPSIKGFEAQKQRPYELL